jgi:hypothetical protein
MPEQADGVRNLHTAQHQPAPLRECVNVKPYAAP